MRNYSQYINQILCGHALEVLRLLPSNIAQCCITSPPYWGLRCYSGEQERIWGGKEDCQHEWKQCHPAGYRSDDTSDPKYKARKERNRLKSNICAKCGAYWGALGLEAIHDCLAWAREKEPCARCYVCHLRTIFTQVKRVLRDDGVLWLNLGDCYAGSGKAGSSLEYQRRHAQFGTKERKERLGLPIRPSYGLKSKDLVMIPSRVAMALQADGYTLRSMIPWIKRNTTPESVRDRPTIANEFLFMLTKSVKPQYWTHPLKRGTRKKQGSDYIYMHKRTKERVSYQPVSDRILKKFWMRQNLWRSHQHYYDIDAVRLPHKTEDKRNISDRSQRYRGKFDKKICETVSSPRARQNREGYTPSYYHTKGRNRRTTDWWYDSLDLLIKNQRAYLEHLEYIKTNQWLLTDEVSMPLGFNVNTKPFKQAHFAVFPRSLIRPCILASTSPKACTHCDAPYACVTKALHKKAAAMSDDEWKVESAKKGIIGRGGRCRIGLDQKSEEEKRPSYITVGWQPTCDCNPPNDNGKCIVLDPFIGSGTVAIEAINNGRNYIGIDISKEYVEMAKGRIKQSPQ